MSGELQNDSGVPTDQPAQTTPTEQSAQVADQNTGAELATDTDGQQEQITQVDDAEDKAKKAQIATQKVISDQHFQTKKAEREVIALQSRVDKFEQTEREAAATLAGNIPEFPSELDDDFESKKTVYNAAIANKATFEANQANFATQQQNQQEIAAQQQVVKDNEMVSAYNAKAIDLGISQQELQTVSDTISKYNMPTELLRHIVGDPDGVLIMKHLAADPVKAMTLTNMSVYEQGSYLAAIKAEANALKPTQTNTPPPPDVLTGGQAVTDASLYPNSAGATFSTG